MIQMKIQINCEIKIYVDIIMFGSDCQICGCKESTYYSNTNYLCGKCIDLKKIIDLYTIESVVETLKYVYVREDEPIKNRRHLIITQPCNKTTKM